MRKIYLVVANGDSAVFNRKPKFFYRHAFIDPDKAKEVFQEFRASCVDRSKGLDYMEDNDHLTIDLVAFDLVE